MEATWFSLSPVVNQYEQQRPSDDIRYQEQHLRSTPRRIQRRQECRDRASKKDITGRSRRLMLGRRKLRILYSLRMPISAMTLVHSCKHTFERGLTDERIIHAGVLPTCGHHIHDRCSSGEVHTWAPSSQITHDLGSAQVYGNPKDIGLSKEKRGDPCYDGESFPPPLIELNRRQDGKDRPHIGVVKSVEEKKRWEETDIEDGVVQLRQ